MNRKRTLWGVIILASLTTTIQYAIQGAMASNHNPADWNIWFWYTDFALWGLRAMIEAVVIAYLFTTVAEKRSDKITLIAFETIMLTMIAVTLHAIYKALGQSKLVHQIVSPEFYTIWTYAIAAYAPIMMAGVGVAYRIQPLDSTAITITIEQQDATKKLQADCIQLQEANGQLSNKTLELQAEIKRLRDAKGNSAAWDKMPATWRAAVGRLAEQCMTDGDKAAFIEAVKNEVAAPTWSRAGKDI